MRERGALGARRRNHSLQWPCVLVVMFMSFGIRKCQVQILTQRVTSYVNLRKFCKNSETLKCNKNLIIQVIQNKMYQGVSKEDFPEKVTLGLDK